MPKGMSHAILTIRDAGAMPSHQRRMIGDWLRKQAKALTAEGKNYSTRFTARYMKVLPFLLVLPLVGCASLHEEVQKAAPLVANVCQDLPVLAVSVRMAVNYVPDQRIKADLTTAALVLSEAQKLCPPAPVAP